MHTHRAIFEVNLAGAGPRWRLSDALERFPAGLNSVSVPNALKM